MTEHEQMFLDRIAKIELETQAGYDRLNAGLDEVATALNDLRGFLAQRRAARG